MAIDLFGNQVKPPVPVEEPDEITFYSFIQCICTKRGRAKLTPYLKTGKYSQFLINNVFMQPPYTELIMKLNMISITNEVHFTILFEEIPRNKGYLKNLLKKAADNKMLKAMNWKFEQRPEILLEYIELMDEEAVEDIIEEHKVYLKKLKKG